MTRLLIASDHAGVELKSKIVSAFQSGPKATQFEIQDLGPQSTDSVDYPDYANLLCQKLHGFTLIDLKDEKNTHTTEFGILICGSGQGMAIRANKFPHIRAALCWNVEIARLAREHNDANVLCLGGRVLNHELCLQMVDKFLETPFEGGRHRQRVIKLNLPV